MQTMKHHYLIPAIAIVAAAAPSSLHAQTPVLIPYQGRVQTGTPPNATDFPGPTGQFKFALVAGTADVSVRATATAVVTGVAVTSIIVGNQGNGYTSVPNVTIHGGAGSGATATAVMSGGRITSIIVNQGGGGYKPSSPPTVTIDAPLPRQEFLWVNNGVLTADPALAVSLPVSNGLYSVLLGDTSDTSITNMAAIPPAVFARPDVRLRVWFNGTQLIPDQRLAPTGYVSQLPSLSFGNSLANTKIAIYDDGTFFYGMGIQNNQFRFHTSNANDHFSFLNGPDGTENFTIRGSGNVGIGNNNPSTKLHVSQQTVTEPTAILQGGDAENELTPTRSGLAFSYYSDDTSKHFITTTHSVTPSKNRMSFWLNNNTALSTNDTPGNGTTNAMTLTGEGRVGIGTSSPNAKLTVVGSQATGVFNASYLAYGGGSFAPVAHGVHNMSIFADGDIMGQGFYALSDERIKNIRGQSDGAEDLRTLRDIRITDYRFKDEISQGNGQQKKVIAQQVEKVFPQAVNQHTGVVPDIFKKAAIENGWVALKMEVKQGDRVRLIGEKHDAIHEVLEVKKDSFRTDFKDESKEVFVYGREVKDVRAVDYEAIAMLNVSATQELARKLEAKDAEVLALQKENATLKAELAANTTQDKAQDAKLAALAALLEKQTPATAAAVSTVSSKR